MKQSVSPAMIAIALVVVLVVVFAAYKLTMGKGKVAGEATNVPGVGGYGQGMPGGGMPGATPPGGGAGGQAPPTMSNMAAPSR